VLFKYTVQSDKSLLNVHILVKNVSFIGVFLITNLFSFYISCQYFEKKMSIMALNVNKQYQKYVNI
jgi:hypothetical protein